MDYLQKDVNNILKELSKIGWSISLDPIANKKYGNDGCDGYYIKKGSFLFFFYHKIIRPHTQDWTLDNLGEVVEDLKVIIEREKQQKLIIKYQQIFDIEKE